MKVQQIIDQLIAMRNEHGNRECSIHYSPTAIAMEIALIGVFVDNDLTVPTAFELDITTNKD